MFKSGIHLHSCFTELELFVKGESVRFIRFHHLISPNRTKEMCKQTSAGVINDQRILCELPMQRSLTLMIQICLQRPQNLVLLHFYVSLTILEHLSSRSLIQRGRAQIVEKASTGTALLESGNFQLLFSLHS